MKFVIENKRINCSLKLFSVDFPHFRPLKPQNEGKERKGKKESKESGGKENTGGIMGRKVLGKHGDESTGGSKGRKVLGGAW
jgi:hypothetical protein